MELESEEMCDLDSHSNVVLPEEMLEEIFKYLHNPQDLAHARRVCRFWCVVATPLYLAKIDDIEINFSPTDRKKAMYRRDLSDKYREKQRQVPNRKLNQTEIDEIRHEVSMKASVGEGSEDASTCLMTKYCDYVESGGSVQYTNFRFVGLNLNKNVAALRFFALCGKHVKILTVSSHSSFWFCDHPKGICKECLDQKNNNAKYLLNIASLKAFMQTYAPNVAILSLDKSAPTEKKDVCTTGKNTSPEPSSDDDSYEDVDSDSDDSDGDDDLRYLMRFGDVSRSDDAFKLGKKFPPSLPLLNNIQTIRVVDRQVASLCPNMILYQVFLNCPNVTNISNFGKNKDAFESATYDFMRALLNNANTDNLTELFIRSLDATIINTLLNRHKDRLHLKFFKVNHLVTHTAEKSFLRFLKSQSTTLETIMCGLTQKKNPLWSNDKIRFPKEMPQLTHLRIGLGKEEQKHLPARPRKSVAPIDWAKQFPSLKTLMLPEYATNVTVASFFKHPEPVDPLTTVTALELPAKLPTNLMARAGFLFPSVTELAVGIQNITSLRQIWTMWPKLKSLHISAIYYDERDPMETNTKFINLDELLTGFDKRQMEMANDGNRDSIGEPNFPSITSLQDLRELTIFGASYRTHSSKGILDEANWNNAKANAVSDISVHHALIKLPSLKYLDISEHLHNISPSADMELCDRMNLFHEDNETTRNNFAIMCNYRGREEAHSMCRFDTMYKDK